MPPSIEGAREFISKDIGAEELAEYIAKKTGVEVKGGVVWEAFKPPRVEQNVGEIEILGSPRPTLAIVTHELQLNPEYRMMNWIPQVKESPSSYLSPEGGILKAFGITHLENFRYLGYKSEIISELCDFFGKPYSIMSPTRMRLEGIEGLWIFEDYDRKYTFGRLRETLWAIAMLPKPVLEEALKKRHFLLVSEQMERSGEDGTGLTIASITKGFDRIVVEDFSSFKGNYREGEIEVKTPVVLFRYY